MNIFCGGFICVNNVVITTINKSKVRSQVYSSYNYY